MIADIPASGEDMGKFNDLQSYFVTSYVSKKKQRAETKKQKSIEKHGREMQERGEKYAQELRDQKPELDIGAPIINPVSMDGAAGRVAKELSRQAGIATDVRSKYTELFETLRDKNPTLTKRSIPAENTFIEAAAKARSALMALSVKKARQADVASGDRAKTLNDEVDQEITAQGKALDAAAKAALEALKSATASSDALENAAKEALSGQQDDIWREKLKAGHVQDAGPDRHAQGLGARLRRLTCKNGKMTS